MASVAGKVCGFGVYACTYCLSSTFFCVRSHCEGRVVLQNRTPRMLRESEPQSWRIMSLEGRRKDAETFSEG